MAVFNNYGYGGGLFGLGGSQGGYYGGGMGDGMFTGTLGIGGGQPFAGPIISTGQDILMQNGGGGGGGSSISVGTGGGVVTPPVDVIINNDNNNNDTPVLPGGAFDYGSGKIYTAFTNEDVVEGGTKRVTRGLWSGNSGELTVFHTSSFQSNTQKAYYYEIYNGLPSVSTNEPQFSIAYGHYAGSGSAGTNEDSPSSAIYSQLQQVLLPANQKFFRFEDTNQNDVYAIAINRARIKDRLDPGNWELCISASAGKPLLRLIDDSGDTNQAGNPRQTKYNIVSGSLAAGVQDSSQIYGEVYPQHGIIVLGAHALDQSASMGTVRTQADNQNHGKLFTRISASAVDNAANGFQARNEEEIKSTFYFVRAKNAEYNFSNNPTFISGSEGKLNQATFIGDPKVYITNIGLFNNDNELLAIAKLSKPLLKSFSNEILVKVKLDF